MNNKFPVTLLVAALCCSFSVVAYAADTPESSHTYEMGEDELDEVMETCHQLGLDNGMSDDDLATFVSECAEANDSATGDDNSEDSTMQVAQEACNEIASENDLEGDVLSTFLAECVEANASEL